MIEKNSEQFSIREAGGACVLDGKGARYIDFYLNGGSLILGHAHRNVVLAVKKYAERGIGFGVQGREAGYLRSALLQKFSSLAEIHFAPSETEALLRACALACRATGRARVVLAGCARTAAQLRALWPGGELTVVSPGDRDALKKAFFGSGKRIAALVLEPLQTDGALGLISPDFARAAVELRKKYQCLLICDERKSALHSALGSASLELSIGPDLICFGGVLGGGFDLGAYGLFSDARIAHHFEQCEEGRIAPLIFRAGLMNLRLLNEGLYAALEDRVKTLTDELAAVCRGQAGAAVRVERIYHMFKVHFSRPRKGAPSHGQDEELRKFLFERGIYSGPEAGGVFSISSAHTKKQIGCLKDALIGFLTTIAQGS
ncbi:MAG TPA: aminotransferase class III-fold pyridoxal phosphate-dependent enzyme [Candidatus Omnitrophota bacterium]|nr:aminotransferase class III-fold pyridoxal phosphate-dependent enzyme [Candidatus Omnitrophota bacterium]HSA30806.1 aminotransferase class III-fold pyridoxal phosphate-dependent enzyme [Candidatus Omnitrophota bacterium]